MRKINAKIIKSFSGVCDGKKIFIPTGFVEIHDEGGIDDISIFWKSADQSLCAQISIEDFEEYKRSNFLKEIDDL